MKCPICRRLAMAEHKPFCSKRCAEIDLGGWLSERYAIPKAPNNQDEDEDEAED